MEELQEQTIGSAEETAPQVTETETEVAQTDDTAVEPFLTVDFNHESKGLSQEETKTLAQKGLNYDKLETKLKGYESKLSRIATLQGKNSVEEYLDGIEAEADAAYRKSLEDEYGEDTDTIDQLMELHNIKKEQTLKAKADAEQQKIDDDNARIAQEFNSMRDEFGLTEYKNLPDSVKKAAFEGKPLRYAYLDYLHKEQIKIDAEKTKQKENLKNSAGSQSGEPSSISEREQSFLKGLYG